VPDPARQTVLATGSVRSSAAVWAGARVLLVCAGICHCHVIVCVVAMSRLPSAPLMHRPITRSSPSLSPRHRIVTPRSLCCPQCTIGPAVIIGVATEAHLRFHRRRSLLHANFFVHDRSSRGAQITDAEAALLAPGQQFAGTRLRGASWGRQRGRGGAGGGASGASGAIDEGATRDGKSGVVVRRARV
jgi:hypothetical protein